MSCFFSTTSKVSGYSKKKWRTMCAIGRSFEGSSATLMMASLSKTALGLLPLGVYVVVTKAKARKARKLFLIHLPDVSSDESEDQANDHRDKGGIGRC